VENSQLAQTIEIVKGVAGIEPSVDEGLRKVSAAVNTGSTALVQVLRTLDDAQIHPLDIALKRPSLDDVFLSLTGHAAEEKNEIDVKSKKRGGKK